MGRLAGKEDPAVEKDSPDARAAIEERVERRRGNLSV
jgi:hypothetical protein